MLRQIIGKFLGGGRSSSTGAGTTTGAGSMGGSGRTGSSGDIERGARTLFRGLRKKRSGL